MSRPAGTMRSHTPLIQQYLDIKARYPDSIVLFRVGDFYEMFFDDAREGSELLGLTLTSRNNGSSDVPLAGVPARAIQEYLPRLIREGRRVAICEQVEDASQSEGLVRREVVETVTPGTVLEESLLSAKRNNFVAALAGEGPWGLATADLSTGEFEVFEVPEGQLTDELARLEPAELLLPVRAEPATRPEGGWTVTEREAWRFDPVVASEALCRYFGVAGTEGFGLVEGRDALLVSAAGALLAYLQELRPSGVGHLRPPRMVRSGRYLHVDEMTRRNLELLEPLANEGGTLLEVLDVTCTAMGGRLLRRWVLQPLLDVGEIRARQEAVAELVDEPARRRKLQAALEGIRDLERLASRLAIGRLTPRDFLGLAASLCPLPRVLEATSGSASAILRATPAELDVLDDVREAIEAAISPQAGPTLAAGSVIREGHSVELDETRAVRDGAVEWIAQLQARERARTGIESLKIGYNKVFGYYIEVTRQNLARVPDDYLRKQTLSNAERYFTLELKEWEGKVATAEERIADLEARLLRELRERLSGEVGRLLDTASRVAVLDALGSLAEVAVRNNYVRPEVDVEYTLDIRNGRHPVVERLIRSEAFIPNDVRLDRETFVMVLTGPNMAGKSTVLRQVGLIVLMSQMGSFVPADSARIGIADRIFTRVGASDRLTRGQSTFMVEMTETATILNGASERSLILLDEIGRGTSTYDGVSIAWAVTEYIHQMLGARTICATHYHELMELADLLDGVGVFNVAVRETEGEIVFLRRLEPGGCDRSYGVHVARLAGLPAEVIERAHRILWQLEAGGRGSGTRLAELADRARGQLSLFERPRPQVLDALAALDPERITPLQALSALARLKEMAEAEGEGNA